MINISLLLGANKLDVKEVASETKENLEKHIGGGTNVSTGPRWRHTNSRE